VRRASIPAPTSGDLVAAVSVGLVLVPQALAYAGLAGLPPQTGLYASALPVAVAAVLASSPYLQTGPTAATSLLTLGALSGLAVPGSPEYLRLAALLALVVGAIRLAVGLARMGAIAYLMSQPVSVAFTAAAGLLIILSQVPAVLGVAAADANPLVASWEALRRPGSWDATAVAFAAATLAIVLGARRLHPLVPGAVVAVAGSIVVSRAIGFDGIVLGPVSPELGILGLDLPWSDAPNLLVGGAVIALIGFAEPAAIARHYAMMERRRWDPSRELASQGAANLVSGLVGGFPVGGSFSRTALAKLAGARTRWSGVLVGAIVLAALPLLRFMGPLPRATLGAIVVAAVLPLVNLRPLIEYWRAARLQSYVAWATFVATLATAPRVERGVVVGVLLAMAAHLYREGRLTVPTSVEGDVVHVRPRGVLFYASAPALEEALGQVLAEHPGARAMVFHLDGLGRIDLTGALALQRIAEDARAAGLRVGFVDVPPQARKIVERVVGRHAPVSLLVEDFRPTDVDRTPPGRRPRGAGP
jgi:SulP family sulfate permease